MEGHRWTPRDTLGGAANSPGLREEVLKAGTPGSDGEEWGGPRTLTTGGEDLGVQTLALLHMYRGKEKLGSRGIHQETSCPEWAGPSSQVTSGPKVRGALGDCPNFQA